MQRAVVPFRFSAAWKKRLRFGWGTSRWLLHQLEANFALGGYCQQLLVDGFVLAAAFCRGVPPLVPHR